MNFGDKLRSLIEEKGLTQKELAATLHIAPSTLGSYVQNSREPDFEMLKKLADFFAVSTDCLLDHQVSSPDQTAEKEILRIFQDLTEEQKSICVAQCRVFLNIKQHKNEQ